MVYRNYAVYMPVILPTTTSFNTISRFCFNRVDGYEERDYDT